MSRQLLVPLGILLLTLLWVLWPDLVRWWGIHVMGSHHRCGGRWEELPPPLPHWLGDYQVRCQACGATMWCRGCD